MYKHKITKNIVVALLISILFWSTAGCGLLSGQENNNSVPPEGNPNEENEIYQTNDKSVQEDAETEEQPPVEPIKPKGKTTLTISVVGDIMVHMHQLKAALQDDGTYDFQEVFQDVKPYLEKADIALGNLETTISTDEIGYTAYPRFRTPESILSALKYAGFDVITTANNHSLDGTEFGVENTLNKLDEYGFLHTGTARSPEERDEILIVEKNDIKVAILAYTYGTNGMEGAVDKEKLSYMVNYLNDEERIKQDIQKAKEQGAEIIIGCIHWGDEYVRQPNETQRHIADRLFSYGMDVIFGSHPHVLQPMERNKVSDVERGEREVFVIYSLGNFVSNQRDRYKDSGVILNLEIVKDYDMQTIGLGRIDYIPTWVYRYTENGKLHYRILPVVDYMDENLLENGSNRIKEVWQETTQHLNNEEIRARQ
jgi:Bacterial capsule synthesis protein PGA_cap.